MKIFFQVIGDLLTNKKFRLYLACGISFLLAALILFLLVPQGGWIVLALFLWTFASRVEFLISIQERLQRVADMIRSLSQTGKE